MADDITRPHPGGHASDKEPLAMLAMDPSHRAAVEARLKRKLDLRCGLFVLIYIMNNLDRNNIAVARLKGLQKDLALSDRQYATCVGIVYVGFVLVQVPSNMLINRVRRPSLYISLVMLLWGLISTLTGLARGFCAVVAIRLCLGFVEAAFLPGALLILSKWYTRRELTYRNAIFFSGLLVANAFGALIGVGVLSNMQGVLGQAAWRWLFWLEGAITMALGMAAAVVLPDLPTNTRGFGEEELQVAQLRMTEDVGEADADPAGQSVSAGLLLVLRDPKVYLMTMTFTAALVGLSFAAYFPTLTATLGFSTVPTLLLSAPPWLFACFASLLVSWHADRTQEKFWHIAGPIMMGMVGFVVSMSTPNVAARYVALFLQTGSLSGVLVIYSWISSSFPRPPAKRAVALALVNSVSQLGSVAGSYVWDQSANGYRGSYGIVTAMFGFTLAGLWAFKRMLNRLNRDLDRAEQARAEAETKAAGGRTAPETKKGFRYLV